MYSPEALLTLARAYTAAKRISLSTLARKILANDKFFWWIENGGDSKYRNVATASDWFDANWPDDVPWPRSVKRRSRRQPGRRKPRTKE
jgi:hypothetical protein